MLTEYRIKVWLRILYVCVGIFCLCVGGYFLAAPSRVSGTASFVFLLGLLPMLCAGIYVLALALRSRLVLDGTRIQVQSAFREHAADLSEIEGYRTVSSRNSSYRRIYLKDGRGSFRIPTYFEEDETLRAWFGALPDLDLRDRDSVLEEIAANEALGETPEQRLEAVARARRWAMALNVLTVAAALALNLGPIAIRPWAAALAMAAPFLGAGLTTRYPLLYSLFKPRQDPRADTSFVLLASAFGLFLRSNAFHPVSTKPLWLIMISVALALSVAGFASVQRNLSRNPGGFFVVLLFTCGFAYGSGLVADGVFDHAPFERYPAQVAGKHVSRGRSTTYYLQLSPWGPIATPQNLSVSGALYRSLAVGDTVCLGLHPGALGAPWFAPISCALPEN